MTENKFTPGPWELQGPKQNEEFGNQKYWTIKPNPYKSKANFNTQYAIGFLYPASILGDEEQLANAELIASAPQLKIDNDKLAKTVELLKTTLEAVQARLKSNFKSESLQKQGCLTCDLFGDIDFYIQDAEFKIKNY